MIQPSAIRRAVLDGTGATVASLGMPATVLASRPRIEHTTMSHATMKDGAKIYYKD